MISPDLSMSLQSTGHSLPKKVIQWLDDMKATDIVDIDLSGKTSIADSMVIATGSSARHVVAMANDLAHRCKREYISVDLEGVDVGDWVLVDLGDVIVHLFREEIRAFYDLEKMWL